jgi:hypothetical protein
MASVERVNCLFKQQAVKQPKVAQLDRVLYKWFTVMRSEGKLVTESIITEKKLSPFFGEMQKTEKCTFSEGWL